MLNFTCIHRSSSGKQTWEGKIDLINRDNGCIEAAISGRGSYFHVITGPQINGHYICIPNHEIGSELSSYENVAWNTERLGRKLKIIDAVTVATGLAYLQEIIT